MKELNRRKFIKLAIMSGMIIGSGEIFAGCGKISSTTRENEKLKTDMSVKFLRQIITADPKNSRCVMWQVEESMNAPQVEVRLKDSAESVKFSAVDSTFEDDGEKIFQYTARTENLLPESDYKYRIIDGEHCTNFFELKTASDKKFKAIIFPDSQSADYDVWGKIARLAFEKNPDAEFFVNVGDLVDNGEDKNQWRAWLEKISEQIKKIPFVPVMGNHETYLRAWQVRLPVAYLNYFAVPDNGSEKFSRYYYSFDFGAAHIAVLDTQQFELAGLLGDNTSEQKNWLYEDFQASDKTWKIIFMHRDVLQYKINGRPEIQEGFSEEGINFMPLFDELKIDVVFTAHLHTYRNRGRLKNFVADNSGTLYILTGLAGDVRYPGLWADHSLDKVTAPQPEIDNYLTLEVDEKNLSVKCFLSDGSQIDEVNLKKD